MLRMTRALARSEYGKQAYRIRFSLGPLAHLVERLVCTEEATGPNPVGSTNTKQHLETQLPTGAWSSWFPNAVLCW